MKWMKLSVSKDLFFFVVSVRRMSSTTQEGEAGWVYLIIAWHRWPTIDWENQPKKITRDTIPFEATLSQSHITCIFLFTEISSTSETETFSAQQVRLEIFSWGQLTTFSTVRIFICFWRLRLPIPGALSLYLSQHRQQRSSCLLHIVTPD